MLIRRSAALLVAAMVATLGVASAQAQPSPPPNVVVIMIDDAPVGVWDAMPTVQAELLAKGVDFTNAVVPTSLCCPSRSSFLTGNYAHTTGVYSNRSGPNGGWPAFAANGNEQHTLATALDAKGYHTALVGKYLNGWDGVTVPPGWDEFIGVPNLSYYDYQIGGTVSEVHGSSEDDYLTDVLNRHAVDVVSSTDQPLFLYYAPFAAHGPFTPAPRHLGTWHAEPLPLSVNERDLSDKAPFMRGLPLLDRAKLTRNQQRQHETLMSVDEGVAAIIDALGERASNTLFVLMSDNGFLFGAHRLTGKDYPYAQSSDVPMVLRQDGVITPGVDPRLMLNIDVTATIVAATGADLATEGASLFGPARTGTVLEQLATPSDTVLDTPHPAYCGYRTPGWTYIRWNGRQGEELYRLSRDPGEMYSLDQSPRWQKRLRTMRQQARASCSPTPPGFSW